MNRTTSLPSFSRPLWAEIDLGALQRNMHQLRSRNGNKLFPVIKANAYGHGAIQCAQALETHLHPEELMCVASVDEGIFLRQNGITRRLLLLSALLPDEAAACAEYGLTATISSLELAEALENVAQARGISLDVHLKIDSGMGRLGALPTETKALWERLSEMPHLRITGILTHFACADEEEDPLTKHQLELFNRMLDELLIRDMQPRPMLHIANSAATWRYPHAAFDAVRPGIALYGVSPFDAKVLSESLDEQLIPVMTLKARITLVRNLPAQATVSYGATWRCSRPTRLAVVPCGYADGYRRSLSNCGKILLRGTLCPVVGRVTMDQILVDVTDLTPAVQMGEEVVLWGKGLPVTDVARWAGTIGYELLTGVAARVPRIYN